MYEVQYVTGFFLTATALFLELVTEQPAILMQSPERIRPEASTSLQAWS